MKYIRILSLLAAVVGSSFSGVTSARAETTNVHVASFSFPPGQIRLVVGHPLAGATNFTLQASYLTNAWLTLTGTTVRVLAVGQIELTAPRPTNNFLFFRVLTTVATNIYPFPFNQDSDGDGFSDLNEIAAGTDPNDPNSFPTSALANLPVVTFTNSNSRAVEGQGDQVVQVTFDRPFFGTLNYTVNPRSTAVPGVDYVPLSGSVVVAGTAAAIVVTPIDDLLIKPERSVILDLTTNAQSYRLGIRSTHLVGLVDDDAYWSGTLKDAGAERNFRVTIARSNSVTSVWFVAGAGFDGLAALTNEVSATSLTEGIIPVGRTNATVLSDTATVFQIISPSLSAESGNLFAGSGALARTFTLVATNNQIGNTITSRLIAGTYTERIGLAGTSRSFLDRTNTGTFALAREIPARPASTNAFTAP